jgi:DNA-binding CsgD family transcriptional regulator
LSARETQVLALLAEELVNKQIAARLGISPHTVKTHLGAAPLLHDV